MHSPTAFSVQGRDEQFSAVPGELRLRASFGAVDKLRATQGLRVIFVFMA